MSFLLLAAHMAASAAPASALVFTDVSSTALPSIATSPGQDTILPSFSGGAAVGDCDGDARPDLYFTGAGHDVLYRNRGDGTFEDVTVAASLGQTLSTRGAGFGDIDNDGDLDLVVSGLYEQRTYLFVNDGGCRFSEEAVARGAAASSMSVGRTVSFGDFDRDGWLDIFVAEFSGDLVTPNVVPPTSRLFRNRGAASPGYFDDVTLGSGLALDSVPGSQAGTFPHTGLFTDLDHDGWPDLALCSDFHESRLFWNDGDATFTDGTAAAGVGTDEHGMGGVSGDLDGDGDLDLFVTSIYVPSNAAATGNRLYRNDGGRTFSDVTDLAGVRNGMWGWGADAFDFDNDGDLDLAMTNGAGPGEDPFVADELGPGDFATLFSNDPVRLWQNDGTGTFAEVSAALGLVDQGIGQGLATFDYDRDGDLDVLLTHDHDNRAPRLYRNDGGNQNAWIAFELVGTAATRSGIGARITVTPGGGAQPMVREVSASGTFLAQNGTGRAHFGLGTRLTPVDTVRIEWPSGTVQLLHGLAVNDVYRVTENGPVEAHGTQERACILALNDAGARVASAVGRQYTRCIRTAMHLALPAGQTVEQCIAEAASGPVAAAESRTRAVSEQSCGIPPRFGPRSADEMNAAMRSVLHVRDVFGPSPDAVLAAAGSSRPEAVCQRTVTKGLAKLMKASIKAFNTCKKRGLADGSIATTQDLEACQAGLSGEAIQRRITALEESVARACAGLPAASSFPGRCATATPSTLARCLAEQVDCGVCSALNAGDHLAKPCHHFSDGAAAVYCGDRPVQVGSIARVWNEQLLDAIRRDTPRPTVHARNLFHLSAVMWDAWRAYGGGGTAWVTDESHASGDPDADRTIAISFAAYRLLASRFQGGPGASRTQAELQAKFYELGFDVDYTETTGNTPAAVGNRIAAAMIAFGLSDGSNQQADYADPSYAPVNAPMIVKNPGTTLVDPNRWQPLALETTVSQNGILLPDLVQSSIGMRWNQVTPFALVRGSPSDLYIDPGPPPLLRTASDAAYKEGARSVIEYSSWLGPFDGVAIDVSPGALGNNSLGTNDGTGHAINPVTGQPYAPNVVPRGDFLRVLAEFWADGPSSETPPGHWNVIANQVSDVFPSLRIGGTGPVVGRLEWDAKLYFALNGAVHDAAVVAWGVKRVYDSVRPISMIRYLAGNGQSSDPGGPAYAPDGLPLQPGLIEVVTAATTAPGERHERLAGHEGEIAIFAHPPPTGDGSLQLPIWMLGVDWMPYQRPTFVTPAFPGFISGHSTFSRAAAEVMTAFTGDAFVPGGLGEFHAAAGAYLGFEPGPSVDVRLQWATYYDAADLAGLSRIAGGIHVSPDDFNGRIAGAHIGIGATARAMQVFAGAP